MKHLLPSEVGGLTLDASSAKHILRLCWLPEAAEQWNNLLSTLTEDVILILNCYVDESGTHDPLGRHKGAEVVGVGGFMAYRDDWEMFRGEWLGVLNRYGVKVFHSVEFMQENIIARAPNSPYRGWGREKRERFILDLLAVVTAKAFRATGIVSLVEVQTYNKLMPEFAKKRYQHPYFFCLQVFFGMLLDAVENKFSIIPPNHSRSVKVACIFDRQLQFSGRITDAYYDYSKRYDRNHRMGSFTFALQEPDDKPAPLQASDLLLYRWRKLVTRQVASGKPSTENDLGSWDRALFDCVIGKYHNQDTLKALAQQFQMNYASDPSSWCKP